MATVTRLRPIISLAYSQVALRNTYRATTRISEQCRNYLRNRHEFQKPQKSKADDINPLYEDPELHVEPEREEYEQLWLHVQGYDFAQVESYTKFLHHFVDTVDPSATSHLIPPRCWDVETFKPKSEVVDHSYKLKKCHRLIKVNGMPNNITSLLMDMVTRHLPSGVELTVTEPDEALDEFIYVPDADIIALKQELEVIDKEQYNL